MSHPLGSKHLISHSVPLESKLTRKDVFFEKIRVFDYLEQITSSSLEGPRVINQPQVSQKIEVSDKPKIATTNLNPIASSRSQNSVSSANSQYRPALQSQAVVEALLKLKAKTPPQAESKPASNQNHSPPAKTTENRTNAPHEFQRASKKTISYRIKNNRNFTNTWSTTPILTPFDDNDSN